MSQDNIDRRVSELVRNHDLPPELGQKLAALLRERRAGHLAGQRPSYEERYEDRGLIAMGGMGEVRRVLDRHLNREIAVKILRDDLDPRGRDRVVERFLLEAEVTAQLQHPGVVPVHDMGETADGRLYFTMKVISDRHMGSLIEALHAASSPGRWGEPRDGATFRGLVEVLRAVCATVAYAHSQGVYHRDLKPENVVVGHFGEVVVVDWGLVRLGRNPSLECASPEPGADPVVSASSTTPTADGAVVGTPAYMPPERAFADGEVDGPRADVYSLGAVLYHLLSGRPPFAEATWHKTWLRLISGPPERVSRVTGPRGPLPDDLVTICERAMAREPEDRYPDASAVAEAIREWLEGSKRRERALALVGEASTMRPEYQRLLRQASQMESDARELLGRLEPWAPVEHKEAGWTLQDQAEERRQRAALMEVQMLQRLQAALSHFPGLYEAHLALAEHYRREHERVERDGDQAAAARYELLLKAHDRGHHADYLEGHGRLTLHTDPPGAEVTLYRYVQRGRRLEPEELGVLGVTPLEELTLERGSYLLVVRREGHHPVRYPVYARRGARWTGVKPGEGSPTPVVLPPLGSLGPDDLYVPGGPAILGGDASAAGSLPAFVAWVKPFVIRRHPVTFAEYIRFLDDLVDRGDEEAVERWMIRLPDRMGEGPGPPALGRDSQGHFHLRPDEDGDIWHPRWPVFFVSWHQAMAYTRWEQRRTGLPWRLPSEFEWAKAARGVDGRLLPWGDQVQPTWCRVKDSQPGRSLPATIDEHPTDRSPYGLRGAAGNVVEWCGDAFRLSHPTGGVLGAPERPAEGARRSVRGAGYGQFSVASRLARRDGIDPNYCMHGFGFRLARSLR